jgi:hypothetical protein
VFASRIVNAHSKSHMTTLKSIWWIVFRSFTSYPLIPRSAIVQYPYSSAA